MRINTGIYACLLVAMFAIGALSCSKDKSYSELLRSEEKAVNWYMSNQKIVSSVPKDSVFETGPDAPFYRMDQDGYIYMQVVNPGTKDKKAKKDQLIYFRYMRTNIIDMYEGRNPSPSGNADNLNGNNSTSFRFDNLDIQSSASHGSGVQLPLRYLGIDCEVNIVIRSYYGFISETGACQPYIYNIKYFSAQY